MGKTPFKMRGFSGFGNSPMTKKSPAKDDPEATHPEHHKEAEVETEETEQWPPVGTINNSGTRVIDETGEWTGVGDRPDLASKAQIAEAIRVGKKAPK